VVTSSPVIIWTSDREYVSVEREPGRLAIYAPYRLRVPGVISAASDKLTQDELAVLRTNFELT
jgi:hypothetical protein